MARVAADTFPGAALRAWWHHFQENLLDAPISVASGAMLMALALGGAAGSFWFDDNDGQLAYQWVDGDFDIAADIEVTNLAGDDLPPSTGNPRLLVLAAHDPYRPAGLKQYFHRGIGRAPGMTQPGDDIVDERKATTASVSDWDTFAPPTPGVGRMWVRLRRVGQVFSSWTSADGVTWGNEYTTTMAGMPRLLQVGFSVYSSTADADVSGLVYDLINLRTVAANSMSNNNQVENDILNWWRGTTYPAAPTTVYLLASTSAVSESATTAAGEVDTADGYARQVIVFAAPAQSSDVAESANDADVTFGPATADWGDITHLAIVTTASGAFTRARVFALDEPRTVQSGGSLTFPAGTIVLGQG